MPGPVRSKSASRIPARVDTACINLATMEIEQRQTGNGIGQIAVHRGQSLWLVDFLLTGSEKDVDANRDIMIVI